MASRNVAPINYENICVKCFKAYSLFLNLIFRSKQSVT